MLFSFNAKLTTYQSASVAYTFLTLKSKNPGIIAHRVYIAITVNCPSVTSILELNEKTSFKYFLTISFKFHSYKI